MARRSVGIRLEEVRWEQWFGGPSHSRPWLRCKAVGSRRPSVMAFGVASLPSELVGTILEHTDLCGLCAAALLSREWRDAAAASRDARRLLDEDMAESSCIGLLRWPNSIAILCKASAHGQRTRLIVGEERRFCMVNFLPSVHGGMDSMAISPREVIPFQRVRFTAGCTPKTRRNPPNPPPALTLSRSGVPSVGLSLRRAPTDRPASRWTSRATACS